MSASLPRNGKRLCQFRGRNFGCVLEFATCHLTHAEIAMENLKDMFVETLKDVYFAENAIIKAHLPPPLVVL